MNKQLLLVAYPLLPVSERSAGGAEQILWTLERELVARGWETKVAACAGSLVAGELMATGEAPGQLGEQVQGELLGNVQNCIQAKVEEPTRGGVRDRTRAEVKDPSQATEAWMGHPCEHRPEDSCTDAHTEDGFPKREREHAEGVVAACARENFAMVLDHSGHFFRHAARVEGKVLATLHLPRSLYAADAFEGVAENVYFNCVSESQRLTFMDVPRVLGVVRNGIAVERFPMARRKSDYVLWLGRICPEKAPHLAIAAAQKAGLPIVLAGQVYPFRWHEEYWEREVKPLIDGARVRWVGLPSFAEKTKLLGEARALLVTSLVAETTSLVALEAMASGTPVIAFDAGALREVVPKSCGFIVEGVEAMAEACGAVGEIRAQECREWVKREYSAEAMADGYEALIAGLGSRSAGSGARRRLPRCS